MDEPTPPDVAEYVLDAVQAQTASDLRELASYCRQLSEFKERPVDDDLAINIVDTSQTGIVSRGDSAALEDTPSDDDDLDGVEVVRTADPEKFLDRQDLERVDLDDLEAVTGGTVVIKRVPCGEGCNGCPHGPYAYLNWRDGSGKVRTKYIRPVEGD